MFGRKRDFGNSRGAVNPCHHLRVGVRTPAALSDHHAQLHRGPFIIWLALHSAEFIAGYLGTIGINSAKRVMGLLLAAIAIKFIASGAHDLLPGLQSSTEIVMRNWNGVMICTSLLFILGVTSEATAQGDPRAREVIELNSRIMHQQILARDPSLFQEVALEQFLVVAPGGRIEDKATVVAGVSVWDASAIEISEEQVIFEGDTAVLVGRIQIDGLMPPVGQLPPMKFMAVFIEKSEDWRLLSRSLTPCLPIAIEKGVC